MMRAALVLLAVFAATAATAVADPKPPTEADKLFDRGQQAFKGADYVEAAKLFESAYELVHDPVYLFNIAQSYRKLLDCERAADFYNRFLAESTDVDKKQRDKITGWLRELQPCLEARQREHEEARRGAEALARQRADEERRRREAAIPRYVEVDRGRSLRIAGLAVFGGGVALLGLGTYEALHGRSLRDQIATCSAGCDWAMYASVDQAGHRANTLAAVGWIGGGVLAAGGAVLYYLGIDRVERVQVSASATGAVVTARLSF